MAASGSSVVKMEDDLQVLDDRPSCSRDDDYLQMMVRQFQDEVNIQAENFAESTSRYLQMKAQRFSGFDSLNFRHESEPHRSNPSGAIICQLEHELKKAQLLLRIQNASDKISNTILNHLAKKN